MYNLEIIYSNLYTVTFWLGSSFPLSSFFSINSEKKGFNVPRGQILPIRLINLSPLIIAYSHLVGIKPVDN